MNLKNAMISKQWFSRNGQTFSRYFLAKTGPKSELVDCDYFIHQEDGEEYFSTSIDLYPEDILAEDFIVYPNK